MAGHTCYHCKAWVEDGEAHDCWTTTEAALTRDLPEDLREAWARVREAAADLGEQRIYASHNSIMFARKTCYFFVRPKKSFLEVCVFLPRGLKHPRVRRADQTSKTKVANMMRIIHRDEVEAPFTDWLREAYDYSEQPKLPTSKRSTSKPPTPRRATPKRPTIKQSARGTAKTKTTRRKSRSR